MRGWLLGQGANLARGDKPVGRNIGGHQRAGADAKDHATFLIKPRDEGPALVLTRRDVQTAPVVATSFMSGYELPWGKIMATGTVIVMPVTIFALIVSRHMVRGLTMGATK
jgi:hypothetical protein